jgi:DNA-binding NarL/FixJ family response regulator
MRIALEAGDIEVVAQVQTLNQLFEAIERHEPDVCLVDVDLNGGGLRAAAEIAGRAPAVRLVLLADDADDEPFLDAIRVGAAGYVPKRIAPERLPNVVRAVLEGEPAIPRALVGVLISHYRARPARRQLPSHGRGVDLTSREWEVLDFMRAGLTTRQIADRLFISEVTVRRHIGSVLKKLRVTSRADALRLLESA